MVQAAHVQEAIDARIFVDRLRERVRAGTDAARHGADETEGARAGQVNGLAVIQLNGFAFGRPSRISARVRLGKGEVVDIEREVALGGPLHSKGVLILGSYLANRYARANSRCRCRRAWCSSSPMAGLTATAHRRPSFMRCCLRFPAFPCDKRWR